MSMAKGGGDKPREFRTISHIARKKPDEIVRIDPPPLSPPPHGRRWKSRLTWTCESDQPFDSQWFKSNIELPYNRDVIHFLDANMFLHPTDDRIWEGLLNGYGRLAIAEPILNELRFWIENKPEFNHRVHAAIRSFLVYPKSSRIRVVPVPAKATPAYAMLEYYTQLLGIRKRGYEIVAERLTQLGVSEFDRELISTVCRQVFGDRTQRVARERRNFDAPLNVNDEALIVLALETSLMANREISIFTRDEGLMEQFYKAVWLLDTHYRGYILGKRHSSDEQILKPRAVTAADCKTPDGREWYQALFGNSEVTLLHTPSATMHELLPPPSEMLSWHCGLFRGNRYSQISFAGEARMRNVLETKGCLRGLTSGQIEPRNIHAWVGPLVNEFGRCGAIAHDEYIQLEFSRLPMLDIVLAMHTEEGVSRSVYELPRDPAKTVSQ